MKKCSKCGERKSDPEFHKCSKSKDGLHSQCRVCRRSSEVKAQQDSTNKDVMRRLESLEFGMTHMLEVLNADLKALDEALSNESENLTDQIKELRRQVKDNTDNISGLIEGVTGGSMK